MARAVRYSASASFSRPVCHSTRPRLLWLAARALRNSESAGSASASFLRIVSAVRYSSVASRGRPVFASRRPMRLTVSPSSRRACGEAPGAATSFSWSERARR